MFFFRGHDQRVIRRRRIVDRSRIGGRGDLQTRLGHESLEPRIALDGQLALAISVLNDHGLVELADRAFDFGKVDFPSTAAQRFVVTNLDVTPIELSNHVELPAGFRLQSELPSRILEPNASELFTVEFEPKRLGAFGGEIVLRSAVDRTDTFSFSVAADSSWNPADDLQIHSTSNLIDLRQSLIGEIWKSDALPSTLPARVEPDVASPIAGLVGVASVERWTVEMEAGLDSQIYFFQPTESNHRLFLTHQGHGDDLSGNGIAETVQSLISRGFSVLTFWMPESGPNSRPFAPHNALAALETPQLNPMKFFVEPVVEAINLAAQRESWLDISMTGISGGGWTTTLAAALDPRIQNSFPVAGSLPEALRDSYDIGDYEQSNPLFYDDVDYLELYALGGFGVDRRQTQVLIDGDPVAYSATGVPDYSVDVQNALAIAGGGEFRLYVDRSQPGHEISPWVVEHVILPTAGADGSLDTYAATNSVAHRVWTLDDNDQAFSATTDWRLASGGAGGSSRLSDNEQGVATWEFRDLPSGIYDIQISWRPQDDATPAAIVTTYAANQPDEPLGQMTIDQRRPPDLATEADGGDPSIAWTTIVANVPRPDGSLAVSLASDGAGFAIADLVRAVRRSSLDDATVDVRYSGAWLRQRDAVSFGNLVLGETVGREFAVQNASNVAIEIPTSVALPDGFEWIGPQATLLGPGETTTVQIQYTASTSGNVLQDAVIDFTHFSSAPLAIQLSATVQPIEVRVLDRMIYSGAGVTDFGVAFTDVAKPLVFTVVNRAEQPLELAGRLTLPTGFELRSQLPDEALATGESAEIEIALAAGLPGVYSGDLEFAFATSSQPCRFAIRGSVVDQWTIDNDSPGAALEGTWDLYQNVGADGDARQSWPQYGPAEAIYRFTNLVAGDYQVALTWTPHTLRATNAVATIYDGPHLIGTIVSDQSQLAANLDPDGNRWTESPLRFSITTGALVVRISNQGDGAVFADAVRVRAARPVAARLHNTTLSTDVNDDGEVTPLDALIIIDLINEAPVGSNGVPTGSGQPNELFYPDVNDDGLVTPLDALTVINILNAPSSGSSPASGEAPPLASSASAAENSRAANEPIPSLVADPASSTKLSAAPALPLAVDSPAAMPHDAAVYMLDVAAVDLVFAHGAEVADDELGRARANAAPEQFFAERDSSNHLPPTGLERWDFARRRELSNRQPRAR